MLFKKWPLLKPHSKHRQKHCTWCLIQQQTQHLFWQHLQDTAWVMCVTEQTAPLLCLVCYESSMIKLPFSADQGSVCFSLVLSWTISEGIAALTLIQLRQVHSTPLWLVVNRAVKGHRSNFTIRPGRSRAPDNTRCWNSGGRKSWDTNRWTHTHIYRHLQRCTGKHKIVSLSQWVSQAVSLKLELLPTQSYLICPTTGQLELFSI